MDKYIKIVSTNPFTPQGVKVWVYGERLNIDDTMIASKYFCGDRAGAIADIKKIVRKQRKLKKYGYYYYYSTAHGDRCILQGAYWQRTDNILFRNAHFQALKNEVKKRNFKAYSVNTAEILPDGTTKKVDQKQVDIVPICRIGYKYIGG